MMQEAKYCQYCGGEISDNLSHCKKCGCEVASFNGSIFALSKNKKCRTCGASFDKRFKTCPYCGADTRQLFPDKLKKCKNCEHHIALNAKKCPNCGKSNYNLVLRLAILGVALVFFFGITSILDNGNTSDFVDQTQNNTASSSNNVPSLLYEDDYFSISYMDIYDAPAGINTLYLRLKIQNNSEYTLTLLLEDVYVNDISIPSGTAFPITLEPGKISQTPFILFTGNAECSADNISKLEFKLCGRDENFNKTHTTRKITIQK